VRQSFSPRASETILLGIIGEGAGQELGAAALGIAFPGLPTLLPRSIKVHSAVRRGRDRSVIGVVAIGHHLLRVASQSLLAALQSRRQLAVIDGVAGRLHIHDQPVRGIGQHLQVVARRRAALAIPHHVGFRIGARSARHKTLAWKWCQEPFLGKEKHSPRASPMGFTGRKQVS